MKYKILVTERETGKKELLIGDNLTQYYAEMLEAQTKLLVDPEKYEVKVVNAF